MRVNSEIRDDTRELVIDLVDEIITIDTTQKEASKYKDQEQSSKNKKHKILKLHYKRNKKDLKYQTEKNRVIKLVTL